MAENYFYSSLSGQEIENTLVGAVRFNAMQGLTTSQKAQARQNIGAGEENTQIKIKGFYATLEDLQQQIPVGNEGDVYAVGTASPYDIYIWDAVNNVWVNDGPISFSDAIIDDNDVALDSVWSSSKTSNEISNAVGNVINDSTVAANKTWSSSKINSKIDNLFASGATAYTTIADLVTFISSKSTGDLILARASGSISSTFLGASSSFAAMLLVMKASSSNAYYYAFTRDGAAIGNINLSNNTVNVVHSLMENAFEVRSVTWTYSCNAGAAANTNLQTLIDDDMPSGYEFVAMSGYTTGNNACVAYTMRYYDNNYSLGIRNVGTSAVSDVTATVYYLCKPI